MTRLVTLLLLLAAGATTYYRHRSVSELAPPSSPPRAEINRLAIGQAAKIDSLEIATNAPAEFDYLTRAAVLQMRNSAVHQHPELLIGSYRPLPAIFDQIVDGAPWWGIEGQFYHGDGNHSIDGPSEESRFILNPYLLVAAEFNDWWKNAIAESGMASFPLVCPPQELRWSPREAYAEVSYDATCIRQRQRPEFGLIAYNARDLGYGYIYVSYADSHNVSKLFVPTDAYENPQFIHKGDSCGYPGGCNNMSPATPDIDDIQLNGLPAKIMVWLWRDKPQSLNQMPDMRYMINFR